VNFSKKEKRRCQSKLDDAARTNAQSQNIRICHSINIIRLLREIFNYIFILNYKTASQKTLSKAEQHVLQQCVVLWRALAFSTAFQSKVVWNQSTLLCNAVENIILQIAISL